jgi:sirohydrochlorin ferrochelatase
MTSTTDSSGSNNNISNSLFIFDGTNNNLSNFLIEKLQQHQYFSSISGLTITTTTTNSTHTSTTFHQISSYYTTTIHNVPFPIQQQLRNASHILITHPIKGFPNPIVQNFLVPQRDIVLSGSLIWVGYLSSMEVYEKQTSIITEEESCTISIGDNNNNNPFLKSEQEFLETGCPLHIFRIDHHHIHIQDLVGILIQSMITLLPNPGRVYNVCNDDVKMIFSNERIKQELHYEFQYPTNSSRNVDIIEQQQQQQHQPNLIITPFRLPLYHCSFKFFLWFRKIKKILKRAMLLLLFLIYKQYFTTVLLIDIGSLRAEPTLRMRQLATHLTTFLQAPVMALSLRYANRIPISKLSQQQQNDIIPGLVLCPPTSTNKNEEEIQLNTRGERIVQEIFNQVKTKRNGRMKIVPLFLAPSDSVEKEIPNLVNQRMVVGNDIVLSGASKCNIASPLVSIGNIYDVSECDVTMILIDGIQEHLKSTVDNNKQQQQQRTVIIMVDHGSPSKQVNRVRRALASRLRSYFAPQKIPVIDCSMERRSGKQYDFNEPLLENVFERIPGIWKSNTNIIIVPAFLFPGNHAGPGGDIEQIVTQQVLLLRQQQAAHNVNVVLLNRLIMDENNHNRIVQLLVDKVIGV